MFCKSPFYSNNMTNMSIYATPCDGKSECLDSIDENYRNKSFKTIIAVSSAMVFVLFIGLTMQNYLTERKSSYDRNIPKSTPHMLTEYFENHDDQQVIAEVNFHLLHFLNTQKVEDSKKTLTDFFNLEIKKHNCNEAKIYLCIHQQALRNSCELLRRRGELHTRS